MRSFSFRHSDGVVTTVSAATEDDARRKAMVARWGVVADAVCPNAPKYRGRGLTLVA